MRHHRHAELCTRIGGSSLTAICLRISLVFMAFMTTIQFSELTTRANVKAAAFVAPSSSTLPLVRGTGRLHSLHLRETEPSNHLNHGTVQSSSTHETNRNDHGHLRTREMTASTSLQHEMNEQSTNNANNANKLELSSPEKTTPSISYKQTTLKGPTFKQQQTFNKNTYRQSLSGLSRAHQSLLAKTSHMRRQRFVTGKYPLYVEVKQNPTKKWLGLAESMIYLNGWVHSFPCLSFVVIDTLNPSHLSFRHFLILNAIFYPFRLPQNEHRKKYRILRNIPLAHGRRTERTARRLRILEFGIIGGNSRQKAGIRQYLAQRRCGEGIVIDRA